MASPAVHHHRSTTKVDHKPFKTRFASKGALKNQAKGKIESVREGSGQRKTQHQQVMSKLARRNQAKQQRVHHKEKRDHEQNIFQGPDGAARHIAVVPLSSNANVRAAIDRLNESVDLPITQSRSGPEPVKVDRFRRNLLYLPTSPNLIEALDTCRLADWVMLVLPVDQEMGPEEDVFIRALEGQGITSVAVVVQDVEAQLPLLKRAKRMAELKSYINHYFPSVEKLSSLGSKADCANLVRSLCTASTKGIKWRDSRSWMHVEDTLWNEDPETLECSTVTLKGTVRGRTLNPDRLVHVPGWGDYRVSRIFEVPAQAHKRKADEMVVEYVAKEWLPSSEQDDLAELAPEQAEMTDATSTMATNEHKGVLLDDHHYFSDDNSHIPPTPKKLPKGTSAYQSAWYLDDVLDSDSDALDDEDDDGDLPMTETRPLGPEDGVMASGEDAMTDAGPSEYPESEMHVDADLEEEARQLENYRASRKTEALEDLEFPDEIELNPEVSARERLVKYRGLKSLRTSEWNAAEDAPYEPLDYKRLLQIVDYKKSSSAAMKETFAGGAPVGTRVMIVLENVPTTLKASTTPSSLFSLLRHEHKHTVVNLNITLHSTLEQPLKSKEELVVQIGHRRLVINPIFSASGQTPNDVHKFDRFLHPGRTAIATFTGPMTWGSVPVLVFRQSAPSIEPASDAAPMLLDSTNATSSKPASALTLIGTATTIPPSSSRIIAKRLVLTGHPYKIHKKLVTIRYMFFNREDVAWFAALPLWTKRGRQGFIKEPLGTHGYFKATFDGKINPLDAVGVSLYKRVWPRAAKNWEE